MEVEQSLILAVLPELMDTGDDKKNYSWKNQVVDKEEKSQWILQQYNTFKEMF